MAPTATALLLEVASTEHLLGLLVSILVVFEYNKSIELIFRSLGAYPVPLLPHHHTRHLHCIDPLHLYYYQSHAAFHYTPYTKH